MQKEERALKAHYHPWSGRQNQAREDIIQKIPNQTITEWKRDGLRRQSILFFAWATQESPDKKVLKEPIREGGKPELLSKDHWKE